MNLQTTFPIPKAESEINLNSQMITLGSCFAEVIGSQLLSNKIAVEVNPFGNIFSPIAIFNILNLIIENKEPNDNHYVENQGIWFHLDFHSSINGFTKIELKEKLIQLISIQNIKLRNANFLCLTFGTAHTYYFLESISYIANCHKIPSNHFRKDLVHVKQICQDFAVFYKSIKSFNPNISLILTVSPVRHTKDGMAENSVSKSILRAACHYLTTDFKDVIYFPAFEIMMDELRDYRFYKEDLIHPNAQAEAYIFQRFATTYFTESLNNFIENWSEIKQAIAHRPLNPKAEGHQNFLKNLLQKMENISQEVDLFIEKKEVISRIFV